MERKWPDYYQQSLERTTIGLCREKGWLILLTCTRCGHNGGSGALIAWKDLGDYPPEMTMRRLAERATFSLCGHKGAWVDFRQDHASSVGSFYPR